MANMIARALKRGYEPQQQTVPGNAKPVCFMNRGGEPTVYMLVQGLPEPLAPLTFVLVRAGAVVPDGAVYIGTAEFGGGTELLHLFEVRT